MVVVGHELLYLVINNFSVMRSPNKEKGTPYWDVSTLYTSVNNNYICEFGSSDRRDIVSEEGH